MRLSQPKTWSLLVKFSLTITVLITSVAFTIGATITVQDRQRFRSDLGEKSLLLARSVAVTAPDAILRNDYWALFQSIKKMSIHGTDDIIDTRIITAMVLGADGEVLAHMQPADNPLGRPFSPRGEAEGKLFNQVMEARRPVVLSGGSVDDGFIEGIIPLFSDEKYLGVVRVRLSTYGLYLKAMRSAYTILGLTLLLVALSSILGTAIARRITRPLTAMTEGMAAVGRGDLSNISPIHVSEDDELGKLATTFNRMTAEMADKRMLEQQMRVSEKLVALGRISAGVAHEVNNPLAGMLNCVDTLKKHPDDTELMKRYIPLLDKGLNHIRSIVESLLVELRAEDDSELSDPSCLDDLKGLMESEIDGRDVNLIWENSLESDVRINSARVQQIVHNLIKNSLQAIAAGGTVRFHSFMDYDNVVLEVVDDGPGIRPEYRSHLFDPFFTTKSNGTGLGLWIVYRLVESMHGVVEIDSETGQGTRFRIILPAQETP